MHTAQTCTAFLQLSPLKWYFIIILLAFQQVVSRASEDNMSGSEVIFVVDVSPEEVHESCWGIKICYCNIQY